MGSREAKDIAELFIASDNMNALARAIDALRVADLEALLKPAAYTYDGMVFAIRCRIDSIKAAMGETR